MSICPMPAALAEASYQKPSDPLELELQTVVSGHVGAWNKTQVIFKSNKYSTTDPSLWPPTEVFKYPLPR